jgi:hypothetical protein
VNQLFTRTCTNQTTSLLVHSWSIIGAWTRHKQTWIHKIHHNSDLGEATTFPFIIFCVLGHGPCNQMSFCPGSPKLGVSKFPKFPNLGFSWLWKPITFFADLWLRWGIKKNYSPCWNIFNDMWHATYMQINQGYSRLLVVMSQIGSLTIGPSFGQNLCFKYPNGSCKPILDIYVSRTFQLCKELFNPMSLVPCSRPLKIQESIGSPSGIQLPKWESTWECVGSFPRIFLHSMDHEMWLLGFTLGMHLCKPLLWSRAHG